MSIGTFTRRSSTGILLPLLLGGLLACDTLARPGPAVAPTRTPLRVATPQPQGRERSVDGSRTVITIFLPRLQEDDSLRLQPVARSIVATDNPMRDAMQALIDGPTGDERAVDFEYPLDRRTQLQGAAVSGGTATVDLGAGVERVRGQAFSELAYWAIVYTATQVSGVQRLSLLHNGRPLDALGTPPFPVPTAGTREMAPDWAWPR